MDPETLNTQLRAMARLKAASQLSQPQADFMSCMLAAVLASLPTFLAAFMECLGSDGNGNPGTYEPGQRPRCPS